MRFLSGALLSLLFNLVVVADDSVDLPARLLQSTAWVRTSTQGVATGWIVDAKRRWLITNLHVVGEQDRVEAFFVVEKEGRPIAERQYYLENQKKLHENGRAVRGKVILRREKSDLALIELDNLPDGIRALPLCDRSPAPGENVHSIGNRQDAEALWLYTAGTVRQRGNLSDGYFWRGKKIAAEVPCLIVQSPINQGDSGGALVNDRAEVVGVLSGVRWQAPLAAIAIQVDEVCKLLAEATKTEHPPEKSERSSSILYERLLHASAWVRPSATEGRAAGWIVDRERRLLLTTASGLGLSDLVDVLFPRFENDKFISEVNAYADRIALRQAGLLVRGLVLARDSKRNLALIELEAMPANVKQLTLAKKEALPASNVHAISHPSGVEMLWLYSSGVVRQAANLDLGNGPMDQAVRPRYLLLQIPHQGTSSGGPLLNEQGQVVGMLAAKEAAQQQLGYAITAAELQLLLDSTSPMYAPKSATEFHRRGRHLLARGNLKGGEEALREAIKLAPEQIAFKRDLVDALMRVCEFKKALDLMEGYLDGAGAFEDTARHALLDAYLGNADKARVRCAEILKEDRKCASAHLALGLLSEGNDALADLDEAILLAPEMVEAYRRRALIHEKLGDDVAALDDWSRAIELDPYAPEPIRRRASLHLRKQAPKRAVADFERLIELVPTDGASYRSLASAWLAQGDEEKAIPFLVAALRWCPELLNSVLVDIADHGADLKRRWPDDGAKRGLWYDRALKAIGAVIKNEETRRKLDDILRGRSKDQDWESWGDELEKHIRKLTRQP